MLNCHPTFQGKDRLEKVYLKMRQEKVRYSVIIQRYFEGFIALVRFIALMRLSTFLESYMPTNRVNVPVMINLMLIFIYLFGGALAFTQVSFEVYQRHKIAKIKL